MTTKKIIVTALLVLITLCVPLSLYSQSQDFEMDGTVLVRYRGRAVDVTIPEGVTAIGDEAFFGNGLRSVTIPTGVTAIGDGAFAECNELNSVTIPSTVTSIGDGAFAESGLRRVTIPASVTSIGDMAFAWCEDLTSITVDSQNSAYSSVDGVLFNKNRTVLIQYPTGALRERTYTIPSGVTAIGDMAFSKCEDLTSIIIPAGVTSIGDRAFEQCDNLTSITIPASVTTIGDRAFYNCERLTSITVSRRTTIGDRAFPSTARITYSD